MEFFWIYLSLFSILKIFQLIKNKQKGGIYHAGPTCMWRGTQGDGGKATRTHASACVAQRWRVHI